jgi:hypothetical protein
VYRVACRPSTGRSGATAEPRDTRQDKNAPRSGTAAWGVLECRGPCAGRRARGAVGSVQGVGQSARALLQQHRSPGRDGRRIDPGLERHAGREIERRGVVHRDPVVHGVERQRAAVFPGGRPRRAGHRAGVPASRSISGPTESRLRAVPGGSTFGCGVSEGRDNLPSASSLKRMCAVAAASTPGSRTPV